MGGPFDHVKEMLLDKGMTPQPKPPVTINIPADHPVGKKLVRLFQFYATEERLPSGVVVKHRREDPEAVALVIRELRQAVVDAGGDPSPIDTLHDAPDPMSYLLANINPMLGGLRL
jgi:hypothetical protein